MLYASRRRAVFRAAALWAPAETAISSSLLAFHRTLDDPVLTVPLTWAAHSNGVVLRGCLGPRTGADQRHRRTPGYLRGSAAGATAAMMMELSS